MTNGVLVVKGDLFDEAESNDTTYVVFSDDGRWAGASDKMEQAKLALAEIPATAKSMDGDVARLRVDEKAFNESVNPGETAKIKRETAVEEETFQLPPDPPTRKM